MENRRGSNNSAETSGTMSNDFGNDAVRLCPICILGPPVRIRSEKDKERESEREIGVSGEWKMFIDLVVVMDMVW